MEIRRHTLVSIVLAMQLILAACSCNSDTPDWERCIVVPTEDVSSPSAQLTISDSKFRVSVTNYDEPASLRPDINEVGLWASGTDDDGGISAIQIWLSITRHRKLSDDKGEFESSSVGKPVVQSQNSAGPGKWSPKNLTVVHSLDLTEMLGSADSITVEVWAVAVNHHNLTSQSTTVRINYP